MPTDFEHSFQVKRRSSRTVDYLEFEEIRAVLDSVDRSKQDGRRDYVLLSLMFNTGARAQELIDIKANDLHLSKPFSARIFGKGRRERICPIWPETAHLLVQLLEERGIDRCKGTGNRLYKSYRYPHYSLWHSILAGKASQKSCFRSTIS